MSGGNNTGQLEKAGTVDHRTSKAPEARAERDFQSHVKVRFWRPAEHGRLGQRRLERHQQSAEIKGGPLVQQGAAEHRKELSIWTGFVC